MAGASASCQCRPGDVRTDCHRTSTGTTRTGASVPTCQPSASSATCPRFGRSDDVDIATDSCQLGAESGLCSHSTLGFRCLESDGSIAVRRSCEFAWATAQSVVDDFRGTGASRDHSRLAGFCAMRDCSFPRGFCRPCGRFPVDRSDRCCRREKRRVSRMVAVSRSGLASRLDERIRPPGGGQDFAAVGESGSASTFRLSRRGVCSRSRHGDGSETGGVTLVLQ